MSGLPLEPEMDSLQTTHYALTQIATSRPSVFITSLAREIARFSALIATAPSQGTLANIPSAVLARSKTEILRNIEILMDRQFKEVDNLLLEVSLNVYFHFSIKFFSQNQTFGIKNSLKKIVNSVLSFFSEQTLMVFACNGNVCEWACLKITKFIFIFRRWTLSFIAWMLGC